MRRLIILFHVFMLLAAWPMSSAASVCGDGLAAEDLSGTCRANPPTMGALEAIGTPPPPVFPPIGAIWSADVDAAGNVGTWTGHSLGPQDSIVYRGVVLFDLSGIYFNTAETRVIGATFGGNISWVSNVASSTWTIRGYNVTGDETDPRNDTGAALPITKTDLTSGSSSTNATSYVTASIAPAANQLILLAVEQNLAGTGIPVCPTVTGNGLTWVEVAGNNHWDAGAPNFWSRTCVFRAMLATTPTAGTVTLNFGAVSQDSVAWSIAEFDHVDTTGTNGSGAVVQSASFGANNAAALSVTLATFGNVNNATYGAFGAGNTGATPRTFTPGAGFTEIHDTGAQYAAIGTQWRADNDTTVDTTLNASASGVGGVALEIKQAGATSGTGLFTRAASGHVYKSAITAFRTTGVKVIPLTGNILADINDCILTGTKLFALGIRMDSETGPTTYAVLDRFDQLSPPTLTLRLGVPTGSGGQLKALEGGRGSGRGIQRGVGRGVNHHDEPIKIFY